VIVNGYVPGATDPVDTLSEDEPGAVTEFGVKVAPAPVGRPEALSATEPVKPFCTPTLTLYVAAVPAVTVADEGETPTVKSAAGADATAIAGFAFNVVLIARAPCPRCR